MRKRGGGKGADDEGGGEKERMRRRRGTRWGQVGVTGRIVIAGQSLESLPADDIRAVSDVLFSLASASPVVSGSAQQ